jgi:general secretion pathway protein D
VLDQNALARQILSDNTVLIYPNIAAKQKDYEQQIVRTFYLTNAAPKDVENMLKTVLAAKTLFMDERANAVVIRDTPETVRMAERLVASIDIAEPEVMLEVEVLEISRSAIQDLGIQYPTSATLTPSSVLNAGAAGSAGGLVLWDLGQQNSKTIGISSLSVTLNAMKQAGVANTLASPRIRARNKEKAKVLIGSREPVITNSTTPTAGGTAVVTGSVQYLDVGLTLEAQPTIYLDGDVAIKLNLEVSSILKQITTTSGTVAYEIGTRNANTLLRLKDGETQVLGGLIQSSDARTANSIPLIGEIPILSHLFGTNHTDKEKDEIVLSVTPRIIRMQPHPSADNIQFWYGTETRHALPGASSAAGGGGSAAPAAAPQPVDPTQMYIQPVTPMPPPPAVPPVSQPSNSVPISQREAPGSAIAPVPRQAEESARVAGAGAGADAAPALGAAAQGAAAAPAAAATDVTTVAGAAGATGAAAAASTNTAAVVAGGTIAATGAVAAAGAATPSAVSASPASAAQTGLPIGAPPAAVPSNAAPAAGGAPGGGSALSLDGPREAKVGEEFPVTVRLSTDQSITRLRAQLRFDSSALQLLSADTGDMVPAAAGSPKVQTHGGGAQLDVSTTADEPVQGTGSLMVVNFRAMQPRPASNIQAMLNVLGASGAAVGNSSAVPLKLAIVAAQ